MKLTYDQLKSAIYTPRLHPNGFVQLDLGNNLRLHVWPAERLATPVVDLPLHDHTFGFKSFVMRGRLGNIIYDIASNDKGSYHLYHVMPYAAVGKTLPLQKVEGNYDVKKVDEFWVEEGSVYHMDPFVFHETKTQEPAATVIRLLSFDKSRPARVLCPAGSTPDNTFKRDIIDPEILWRHIHEALEASSSTTLPEALTQTDSDILEKTTDIQ